MSSLLLLPSFVAMAYGELVQIERESFLTSAAILDCVALVEVFCRFFILNVFIIFRFLVLNTVEDSDQPFRVILKRVYPFYKTRNASKGFVLLPASLSNVLHVAMFNLSTDREKEQYEIVTVGYRLPLTDIVFKHECKNVVFPI